MKSCFMKISFSLHIYRCSCHTSVFLPYRSVGTDHGTDRPPPRRVRVSIRTYHVHSVHDFPDFYNAIPWISLRWVAGASARLTARREAPENSRLPSQPFWCEQNFLAVPYLIARRRKEARRRTGDPSSSEKKAVFLPCHASCQAHLEAARPRELTNELTTTRRRTSWRRSRR